MYIVNIIVTSYDERVEADVERCICLRKTIGSRACYVHPNAGKQRACAFLLLVKVVMSGSDASVFRHCGWIYVGFACARRTTGTAALICLLQVLRKNSSTETEMARLGLIMTVRSCWVLG